MLPTPNALFLLKESLQIFWIVCAAIQLLFIVFFISKNLQYTSRKNTKTKELSDKLSIVVCAKNEGHQVGKLLKKLAQQSHKNLEYILVNDGSKDNTGKLFDEWAQQEDRAKVIHIHEERQKDLPGKKYAVRAGIQASTGAYILLTDADCIPHHNDWAEKMHQKAIEEKAQVVLGYGAYATTPHFLSTFVTFETLHTLIQYSSYAAAGLAYMGVGRNLLYEKEAVNAAFEDEKFLETLRKTSSGDDDLTVSYLAQQGATFAIYPELVAASISIPPPSFDAFLRQKQRHTSSSKYYDFKVKFLLGLYAGSHFAFWLGALPILVCTGFSAAVWISILLVFLFKIFNFSLWKKTSSVSENLFKLMLCDFLWSIYNLILSPYIFFKNKKQWK